MQNFKQVWKEMLEQEAKPASSLPTFPGPQLKIDHDKAVWVLNLNGETVELGNQVSMFVVRMYMQTTVFNADGRLVLKSQLYTPREKQKALVLYNINGQFTNTLLAEALRHIDDTEFTVINSWILPIIITSTKEPTKAWWDAKRSALKALINLMKEEGIKSLAGYEIAAKLIKQKNGMKMWSEPKITNLKNFEAVPENSLKIAHEYLTTWESFKVQYNSFSFKKQQEDDDIPVEL